MGKYLKTKKMWNLVVSYPENRNLSRKTAILIEFDFNRKEKRSIIADWKLQVDQIMRKTGNFNKSLFT